MILKNEQYQTNNNKKIIKILIYYSSIGTLMKEEYKE